MICHQTYQGKNMTNSHRLSIIGAFLCGVLFYLGACLPSSAATLLPNGEQTFVGANGDPLASGTVDFYVPGGFVRKNTWLSSTATNPNLNANPVALDAAGRAVIYGIGCYRQIVKNSLGVQQWDKTTCDTSSTEASWGGTATGTPNAIIVTADSFTGADGQVIRFIAAATNSGATTINPTVAGVAFGNVTVLVDGGTGPIVCSGGEIVTGNVVTVIYDSNLGAFHLSTLTSVTAGAGLSVAGVGSSGGTGATSVTLTSVQPVNVQTGTTYTLLSTDNAKLVTFSNTAAVAVTVPAPTVNFAAGYSLSLLNLNSGVVTLTPISGTINGAASLAVPFNSGGRLISDGTNWYFVNGASGTNTSSVGYSNLSISNTVGQENDHILITANTLALRNTSGFSFTVNTVSVTCNYAANWAASGSLDTGTFALSTWYYHYVISNGTTTACLGSTSSTAPTMPAGYTFKMRVGANRTNGSTQFNRVVQKGQRAQYVVSASITTALPNISNGTVGAWSATAPTWSTPSVASFVPTTASGIGVVITNNWNNSAAAQVQLAPNNLYSGSNSTNPPLAQINSVTTSQITMTVWFTLEGTTIAWAASGAGAGISTLGWDDSL